MVTINDYAQYATSSQVNLSLAASPACAEMALSNTPSFAGSSWQPFTAHTPWQLETGDGPKHVFARCRTSDAASSLDADSIASDSIIVDTVSPEASVLRINLPPVGTQLGVLWGGYDAYGEIYAFDVSVKDDRVGKWTDWMTGTHAYSSTFAGVSGRTYCFRVHAYDAAGNAQTLPGEDGCATVSGSALFLPLVIAK
jgi:hypothetical protein